MSGYKASLLPFMPKCLAYLTVTVAAATNHSLASNSPPVTLYVTAVQVTSKSLNPIQLQTTWIDPGSLPPALQGLMQVEEMLISPVMPIMSVYQLPLGQYGYSGHVINLPQDVASFVCSLPHACLASLMLGYTQRRCSWITQGL